MSQLASPSHACWITCLVALLASSGDVRAEITSYIPSPDDPPLYKQSPFDLVTLDEQNENLVLRVYPLELAGRDGSAATKKTGWIDVHLSSNPTEDYQLDLTQVVRIEFYEQMLLKRAEALVRQKNFDEAAHYYVALRKRYPDFPGLARSVQLFLAHDSKAAQDAGRFDDELATLKELYHLNPAFPGLDEALGEAIGRLVDLRVDEENYAAARGHMRQLEALFPGKTVAAVARRRADFSAQAAKLLAEAKALVEGGDYSQARRLAGRALVIWPSDEARQFTKEIHQLYPRVVVGVTSYYSGHDHHRFDSAPARRTSRLMHRRLLELRTHGNEGGKYAVPFGTLSRNEQGTTLRLQLRPGIPWADGRRTMTGHDVARRLLAMADTSSAHYRDDWARLFAGVSVKDVYLVDVRLNRPHVRPEGYLDIVVDSTTGAGPYQPIEMEDGETRYVANAKNFGSTGKNVREIVERYFRDPAAAARALRRGEISVLDRVSPADLKTLRNSPDITLRQYQAPLVHCLVPNLRKPFMANRAFRRALVYGIDRAKILHEELYGTTRKKQAAEPGRLIDRSVMGSRVLSGPFPLGQSTSDSLGYAYDPSVRPRAFEPRVAMLLADLALKEVTQSEKARGREIEAIPTLVLGHPPLPTARAACQSIRQQLGNIGLEVELQELRPGDPLRMSDKFDLLYVELAMWEPVVDARRLLGEEGLVGGGSPYMSMALRKLDTTLDWKETRDALHAIHRIAHTDVTVIPLWQIYHSMAFRNTLSGVADRPLLLYDRVEQWQIALDIPAE